MFDITENKLEKDVTFFNVLSFRNNSKNDKKNKYIIENDIGCHLMCLVIDEFINKKNEYGLNIIE